MTLKIMPRVTQAWGLHYCENCGKIWHTPRELLDSQKGRYGQVNIPIPNEPWTENHKIMHSYLICTDCSYKLGLNKIK